VNRLISTDLKIKGKEQPDDEESQVSSTAKDLLVKNSPVKGSPVKDLPAEGSPGEDLPVEASAVEHSPAVDEHKLSLTMSLD
jgi:hypothetical protein